MFDLKSANVEELEQFAISIGEKAFRGRQIFSFLAAGKSIEEMTSLSLPLRTKLREIADDTVATVERKQVSASDGTIKYLYRFGDGELVESVLLRYKHGNSICISTQAGCKMGCSFCASTINGFRRNLTAGEILEQVIRTQYDSGQKISNIVLMGIGEPLDNFDNVIKFLHLVNDERGMNIGMRHISLSTCGLVDRIYDLAELGLQVTLSVSLHATNQKMREAIMPIAKKYDFETLLKACADYEKATKRRISFEYSMIDGVNDSSESAHELGKALTGTLAHVNLIPLNHVDEKSYKKSKRQNIENFKSILEKYKLSVTVRRSLGNDIEASCGQLRAKSMKEKK